MKKRYAYRVTHQDGDCVQVEAEDQAGALVEAAKAWGERWTALAAHSTVDKLWEVHRANCKKCGAELPEGRHGLCAQCAREREILRLEMMGIRVDRRARSREG